jgi:hypothetical protein
MGESSGRWSNQLQPRESLEIAAPIAGEQGDPLHQGVGADQEIRQHGLARTAPEGSFSGDGTVHIKMGLPQVIHGLDRAISA